ncbi:MAG: AAA family ATPase [Chloroflexota bacterium]|nr:AAA family ATPase [Chloroflexota bacterium]
MSPSMLDRPWTTDEQAKVDSTARLGAPMEVQRAPMPEVPEAEQRKLARMMVDGLEDHDGRAVVVSLATVSTERVEWLWLHRVPRSKLTVLDGDPGLGKSTVTLDLAARVSTGRSMPESSLEHEPAGVVILSAEDGLGDTIRPRLEAAGADLSRIVALTGVRTADGERLPALPLDLGEIEETAFRIGAALIIVDPLMAYLDPTVNSHRDQDIRRTLAPLAAVAERTGAAVLVVRHLNKSSASSALYRGGGSIGIIGAARCGLLVAPDPEDEGRSILAVSKSNLGPKPPALAYRLVGDSTTEVARVAWEGVTEHTAAHLLETNDGDGKDARREAADYLRELLTEPMAAIEVRKLTRANGIADRTLDRAKKDCNVVSEREGFGPGSRVMWRIDRHETHRTSPPRVAMYGSSGDVWDPELARDDDAEMAS